MPDFTCKKCGATFAVRQDIVDRYDNWTPASCLECRTPNQTSAAAASQPVKRPKSKTSRQSITVGQVLEEFTGGPSSGVFTDGSSVPNPGPGGWGAVYVVDGEIIAEAHGHDPATTNNRMELTALIEGIKLIPRGSDTTLYSDSNLAVRTINEWAAGWEKRGWKKKTGEVANLDLVKPLYFAAKSRPELTFEWIKAHDGSRWNEYADALSTAWSRQEM